MNDKPANPTPDNPTGTPPAAVPLPRPWTFRRVRKNLLLCGAVATTFAGIAGKLVFDHSRADAKATAVTQSSTGVGGQQNAINNSTIGSLVFNPPTPVATPVPEPPTPTLSDFAGPWEMQILQMSSGTGDQIFYQPLRFTVSPAGEVSGQAAKTMEMRGGRGQMLTPPVVATLTGKVSSPKNKHHAATGSALDPAGFYYGVADVEFALSDGSVGKGLLGLTENRPVAEFITVSNGDLSGQMYARKQ